MTVLATGQLTIVDYNDALSLTGYIGSNKTKTQMYNPDNGSYSPDWADSNLVLTPSLFILGTPTDIITLASVTSITWWDVTNGIETQIEANASYAIGASKPNALTVKTNVMAGLPGKDFMCKVIYHDDATNMDLTIKIPITFSRVVNGSGITDAVAWLPDGGVFKNDGVASLTAECNLWRGSVVDSTLVTYQWYKQDPTVVVDEGGGIGWGKLVNTASVVQGVTTKTLTIYPDAVVGYEVFKCLIKDTDSASPTYNTYFADTVTVADQSDPIQCSVVSTGGDVFKNGVGSSILTAKLFRAGVEIDAGATEYVYKWYKYNSSGVLVTDWGGAGIDYKTGKTLSVGSADVDTKATFIVEVE